MFPSRAGRTAEALQPRAPRPLRPAPTRGRDAAQAAMPALRPALRHWDQMPWCISSIKKRRSTPRHSGGSRARSGLQSADSGGGAPLAPGTQGAVLGLNQTGTRGPV